MARYIDIEPIEKEAKERLYALVSVELLNEQPTVDVVKVVRCKDCKYYLNSNEKCALIDTRLHFYETDKSWTSDCFCSWGERRDDE